MSKGFVLSMDAVIAASIITAVIIFMSSMTFSYSTPELTYKRLYTTGKDIINVFQKSKISSVYDSLSADFISACNIEKSDMNRSIIDMVGYFWSEKKDICALNLTRTVYSKLFSELPYGFSVLIDGTEIFSNNVSGKNFVSRVSTVVSGYEKEKVARGFVSKVYITKASKSVKTYSYFGGYVGDGNITKKITLPDEINVTEIILEADIGNNFSLFTNGLYAGSYEPKTSNMSADYFTICNITKNYDFCKNITSGDNYISINFSDSSGNYIGGGYFRITYNTLEIIEEEARVGNTVDKKQYLPGIKGLINLYSSFYIPGDIENMSMLLHYKNNMSVNDEGIPVFFIIGGNEVYRENNTGVFNITLNSTHLSSLVDFSNLSKETVPIRFGMESFLFDKGIGRSDSVLITDRSGSMDKCDVNTESCSYSDCNSANGCQNIRMDIAKDVDKVFVDVMLNVTGNRVGLNGYGTASCSAYDLTNNSESLTGRIDDYTYDCGCTCISCGLNKALETIITQKVENTLVERKSEWLYNTSYPTTTPSNDSNNFEWTELLYNDSSWSSGNAILGFENSAYTPNIDTYIGNNNGDYYFRKKFNVSSVSDIDYGNLYMLFDDSAEVYINGIMVFNQSGKQKASEWNRGGIIFQDGFEEGNLDKWIVDSNSDGGVVEIGDEEHTGNYNVEFYGDGSAPNEMWIQKSLNLTGREDVLLRYFWTTEDLESSDHGFLDIYDGTWHTAVKEYGLDNGRVGWWWDYSSSPLEYAWEEVNLSEYNLIENFTIRFRSTAVHDERYDTFLLDDISVIETIRIDSSVFRNGENIIAVKLRNSDSESAKFDLELNYTQARHKAIAVMSDGGANTMINGKSCKYSSGSENPAKDEVVELSCEARERYGVTIYGIAFGDGAFPDTLKKAACWNCSSGIWLDGEGEDNCSRFYQSSNAEELSSIYQDIASDIANATYKEQTITASGDISLDNILYPDSYIDFIYTPESSPLSYGQIKLNYESPRIGENSGSSLITDEETGSKEGWFSIPHNSTVIDAKVTSYSSNFWTDRLWVNSSSTPGQNWTRVYWLENYSSDYEKVGDPYIVDIPVKYLTPGGNNSIRIGTGMVPDNGTGASSDDRIIYTVAIGGISLVGYSEVFPKLNGSTVLVWSDTNGDNIADKSFNISVGPNPSDKFDPMNDSIDDSFMRLMNNLNFVLDANSDYGNGTADNPYDGINKTNPIDIEIPEDVNFNSDYVKDVPSLWGPAIMEVRTWY